MERRWEELEIDCLVNVFERLEIQDLTLGVPFVCKSWYQASLHPHCWKSLNLGSLNFGPYSPFVEKFKLWYHIDCFSFTGFLKFAINRSHKSVIDLLLPRSCTLANLIYLSNECPCLKILGLPFLLLEEENISLPTFDGDEVKNLVPGLVAKWKDLERLHIKETPCYFKEILHEISRHCKSFVGLKKSGYIDREEALAIVNCLPKLKYLKVTCAYMPRKNFLMILKGCKELEELVVKDCCGFKVDEEILKLTSHIKIFEYEDVRVELDDWFYEAGRRLALQC
ncbi:hypothetical protein HHK36_006944 [Tetracentron sinense]|uniref:F-box domain-containing protein n=1 Tax=Tetracentron sinense TaxID=13715 RepID=A0A835DKT1_TETSI|nr:hypothetical protein HHK36_006944 [Tetracentron sinense]